MDETINDTTTAISQTYREQQNSLSAEEITQQDTTTSITASAPSTDNDSDLITVNVGKNYDSFNVTMPDLINSSQYPQRGHEAFLINKKTHSSIAIRQNGQINLASSLYSQYKLNPTGKAVEQALESVALTNRRKVNADDAVINEHKLSPYLYQLTDMRKMNTVYNDSILVGNFCPYGSVLIKAWEPDLKRYVLIRRTVKLPMFSPLLNVPEIHEGVGVTDPLKIDENILLKSDKGYQVNKVYSDSNSLIGREGEDGEGIQRKADISISVGNTTIVDGNAVSSVTSVTTPATASTNTSIDNISVNTSAINIDGMNQPGTGGGQGADKVKQLVAYGTKAGNAAPSTDALTALKAASETAGIPMDWIMGMWIHETGWDLAANKAAVEFKNYGNMHGDSTKISVLKKAGVKCELAHWSADGTNDWVKFDDPVEAGKGWAVWIRYAYSNPPACQQKTAEAFYKSLFDNTGAGFKHGYAGDGTWAGAGVNYSKQSLAVLKSCGGGTVLT